MKDAFLLRDRIAAAIVCAPFVATGCAKDERGTPPTASTSAPSATVATVATSTSTSTATSTSTSPSASAPTEVPHLPNFPPCPGGQFCAPASKMKALARKDSQPSMGCPTSVIAKEDALQDVPSGPGIAYQFSETDTKEKQASGDKTACCYRWMRLCPGGRPLLDDAAQPTVADVRDGAAWLAQRGAFPVVEDLAVRAALSRAWLEDACMEHASIASFARTTLELLSVGAPAALVRDAQRAGMDEVRHAERCFELASFYAERDVEPGPLPLVAPRTPDLARLARDTFIEGCVGETISALAATRAVENAPREVAAVWRMLAADEARHAELAWRTLAWIAQRDAAACAPLRELAHELEADVLAPSPEIPALPGRVSSADLDAVRRDAWRFIITPTLQQLLSNA